jgi:tripartite-type tricarboxylate transporter receptor subunit TctC
MMIPFAQQKGSSYEARHVVAGGLLGAAAGLWARPALAQAPYPSRPIRVVVPIAAGGGTDILVRLIVPKAAALLGGTIVVENRAGAEGVIGTEYVVRAPADGHTLLFSDSSIHINKVSRANLPYDPMTDVLPVIHAAYGSFVLYGNRNFGARNLAELIEKAKAQDRRCCGNSPVVGAAHAVRTYSGRPSFSIRLSARPPMATSVARRSSVRDRRPSPRTRFHLDTSASTRARQL